MIPDESHAVSRADISEPAIRILKTLLEAGFESYLVGGGVRDLLLGHHPKDFDVATAAEPEEVKRLFPRCRLIGRRFRLAHVRIGRDVVEVATFRAGHAPEHDGGHVSPDGRIVRDNVFGSLEEDAWRRDFTINSLYYDIGNHSVIDFTGGIDDVEAKTLRLIGDPEQRYREDPVRILRAIRFAAKLGFEIHPDTEKPIHALSGLLADIPPARLFDETLKIFMSGHAHSAFHCLCRYDVFKALFAQTAKHLGEPGVTEFIEQALTNTDRRLRDGKPVTPGFLFAALLWAPLCANASHQRERGLSPAQAVESASAHVVGKQCERVAFPRRFSLMAREIWMMQSRLERPGGKRAVALLERARFRAAYDFLLLRNEAGEERLAEAVKWWTELQELEPAGRSRMVERSPTRRGPRRRRRRRASSA